MNLFKRDDVINQLFRSITYAEPEKSYVISLEGAWGTGKTTIINNVKKLIEDMRDMILNIAIEEIEQIKEIQCNIHPDLFMDLLKSKQIEITDKRYIIAKQVELGLEIELLKIAFEYLQMTECQQLLNGKRPKIRATLSNEKLLDALLMRNWISSYEEDKEDSDYFQTYGKRKRL